VKFSQVSDANKLLVCDHTQTDGSDAHIHRRTAPKQNALQRLIANAET